MGVDNGIGLAGSQEPINDVIWQLKVHEGFKAKPYRDSIGIWTIGYGINLEQGMTEREAAMILEERVRKLRHRLSMVIRPWKQLSPARQDVLVNMAYNLGISGLLRFKKMLKALTAEAYSHAADEMMNSIWAGQVGSAPGQRAHVIAEQMRKG